jgi:hypothetical protein
VEKHNFFALEVEFCILFFALVLLEFFELELTFLCMFVPGAAPQMVIEVVHNWASD